MFPAGEIPTFSSIAGGPPDITNFGPNGQPLGADGQPLGGGVLEDAHPYGPPAFDPQGASLVPGMQDWSPPVLSPNNWGRTAAGPLATGGIGVRGRPTAERFGVTPDMGGMPQPADRTYATSDVLVKQLLAQLPPVFQQFATRPINRYHVTDAYGDPTQGGGYYSIDNRQPSQSPGGAISPVVQNTKQPPTVAVGIGNDVQPFHSMTGDVNAIGVGRHELIHALSFEAQPFVSDAQNNFDLLRQTTLADFPSLNAPQYHHLADTVKQFMAVEDWPHVFTTLAEANLQGIPLPPRLQQYFAPMFQRAPVVPGKAPPSQPPVGR